ncbi:MAG TPA: hypothetical protein VJ023_07285 [Pyrinomonadaceae bacterium]|nr:hypothetical protein [Pyrinomonadaceae bacterium]
MKAPFVPSVGGNHPSGLSTEQAPEAHRYRIRPHSSFRGLPRNEWRKPAPGAVCPKFFPVAPVRFRDTGAGSVTFVELLVAARPNQLRGLLAGTSEKIRLRAATNTPS